ncbi:MAG: hypothetical protein C4560_02270 [Nitrospiraceae bacterium]|nr:MAG: hypothetical protein C4560_02270 [Nitrospiraceae bacterium]
MNVKTLSRARQEVMTKRVLANIEGAFIDIGYKRHLIRKDYQYADLFSNGGSGVPLRTVGRAVFGQEPIDYRSACFGIQLAESGRPSDLVVKELRAFGAPMIFIINNGVTERWTVTEKEPLLQDKYKTATLHNVIIKNKSTWKPQAIIRAKTGFAKPDPVQLDFVDIGLLPALEHEAAKKIDSLFGVLLYHAEEEFKKRNLTFDASIIFRVVFSLLAAKLLKDRNILGSGAIDFSNPQSALEAVRNHYGPSLLATVSKLPIPTLNSISQEIGKSFSLRNISVDTLTYIYENTFVSRKSRKELGIHSTPAYVADYLLSQVPLEDLPRTQWQTLDPMCGHGILLIAAMRRMRDLLPQSFGGRQRHEFFMKNLRGIEIEPFSIEVARMCLMLADFPESNGWSITQDDAFADKVIENASKKSMILIANPPFEKIKINDKAVPKPLEFLRRSLPNLPEGALIGLVLPRSFLDSTAYKEERKFLLNNFEINAITTLPDKIFLYSEAETAIVSARKREPQKSRNFPYTEVRSEHREAFKTKSAFTWRDKAPQSYFYGTKENRLIVPFLKEVWDRIGSYPILREVALIKTGIRYKSNVPENLLVQDSEFPDSRRGILNVTPGFYQYIAIDTVYMSTKKEHMQSTAIKCPWDISKVILPAARMSRGRWRFAGAIDTQKRVFSRRFYGAWPKSSISVYTLAAILNSPVAQAFIYCNVSEKDILIKTYEDIPVPKIEDLQKNEAIIANRVRRYLAELKSAPRQAYKTLLEIDAEILKLYHLPPKLERQLLDIFWGQMRRVPFEFKGYIPPEMASWIPLHIYLSNAFREGTVEKILERIPVIKDKKFVDYLKGLGTE